MLPIHIVVFPWQKNGVSSLKTKIINYFPEIYKFLLRNIKNELSKNDNCV